MLECENKNKIIKSVIISIAGIAATIIIRKVVSVIADRIAAKKAGDLTVEAPETHEEA